MTVSIINIAPGESIKPRLIVDFRGTLVDDADTLFSLRRASDNKFWNFIDSEWNLLTEGAEAKQIMISIGGGEYDSPAISIEELGVQIGELITAKFRAVKDLIEDIAVDYYKVKLVGAPTMKFPQKPLS